MLATDGSGIIFNHIIKNNYTWFGLVEHKLANTGSLPQVPGFFRLAKAANRNSGGVCMYIKNRLKYKVNKLSHKTKHNILWIKFPNSVAGKDLYICLAYCKTQNYETEILDFYADLAHDVLTFSAFGEVLVVGDFNARLGELTGDRDRNGKFVTNKNAPHFFSFLEATSLTFLNKIHSYGQPTFLRPSKQANSIIDFGFASHGLAKHLVSFQVAELHQVHFHSHNTCISLEYKTSTTPNTEPHTKDTSTNTNRIPFFNKKNKKAFFTEVLKNINTNTNNTENAIKNLSEAFQKAREKVHHRTATRTPPIHHQVPRLQRLLKRVNLLSRKLMARRYLPADNPEVRTLTAALEHARSEYLRIEAAVKRDRWEGQLAELEHLDFCRRTKQFWKLVAKIRKSSSNNEESFAIKNLKDVISSSKTEFCENWVSFYSHLYCQPPKLSTLCKKAGLWNRARATHAGATNHPLDQPLTFGEFQAALKKQRKKASPGFDQIRPIEISDGPTELQLHIFNILKQAFENESPINCLKLIHIKPILKNPDGDVHDPGNFRPIALLSQLFKTYESMLNARLVSFLEGNLEGAQGPPLLNEEANGFRPKRSTLDNIFILRELAIDHRSSKSKKPLVLCFLDIKKAFDKVNRPILWHRLWNLGVQGRFWRVLRNLYSSFCGRVKAGGCLTREFLIRTGVVQGSRLGPTLYNVFLNHLITKIKNNFQGASFSSGTKIPVLGYADDLVLCSNDFSEMQKMLDFCSDYANKNSFEFNTKKCKTLIIKKSKNKKIRPTHSP